MVIYFPFINEWLKHGGALWYGPFHIIPLKVWIFKKERFKLIEMQDYAFHLLRYRDNKFGRHPRFYYFQYILRIHHYRQEKTYIFIKKRIEENYFTIFCDLTICLKQSPNENLAEQLLCFGFALVEEDPFKTNQGMSLQTWLHN